MRPDGTVHLKTDVARYFEEIEAVFEACKALTVESKGQVQYEEVRREELTNFEWKALRDGTDIFALNARKTSIKTE